MKRGRPKKNDANTIRVDYTKVSKYTWAIRLKWRDGPVHHTKVLLRLTDAEFKRLRSSRAGFAAYKRQLVEEHKGRVLAAWRAKRRDAVGAQD